MLNQFHDILPGSSIQRVYQEAEASSSLRAIARREQADGAAAATFTGARRRLHRLQLAFLAAHGAGRDGRRPGRGQRSRLRLDDGPAKPGEANWSAKAFVSAGQTATGSFFLENELVRAEFNARGEIASLWDKESGREHCPAPGNSCACTKTFPPCGMPGTSTAWPRLSRSRQTSRSDGGSAGSAGGAPGFSAS
jgi:alpha-mannosidase